MPDLPSGQWSQLLVGHQWPASVTLAVLGAAATDRAALGSAYDGYADLLRSIHTGPLASQEGLTAESIRQSFRSGEDHAREIAARNLAKQTSYAFAQQWVTELRADLAAIAADGNSEIRRILDSGDSAPQKISAIVQTVSEAQQHANIRAAACCANVCDAIQTVLTATGSGTPARALARSHGVDLSQAFVSPNPEFIHAQVSAIVTAPPAVAPAGGGGADPAALSPDSLDESFAIGTAAGAPLSAGTEAITAGAVNALGATHSGAAAPAVETTDTAVPPLPVAPPPDHAIASSIPGPAPIPSSPTAGAPSAAPGYLPRYGADIRAPVHTDATPPRVPTAAVPVAAPAGVVTAAGLAHSSAVRQQNSRAPTPPTATTDVMRAVAVPEVATGSPADNRLRRLLNAVARQEPLLHWAVGDREDGSTVLVTDLASGWIPPHIDIPAGLVLLEPGRRAGDLMTLLDGSVLTATYVPGRDDVGAAEDEPIPMSDHARRTRPVDDLGWELLQATRWRDGLPRLVHTLARAGIAGTGCLDSEIAMLRRHRNSVARTVLNNYGAGTGVGEVGNWQLVACVEALIDNDQILAAYHFAWFDAHDRVGRTGCTR